MKINDLLHITASENASDLHLSSTLPPLIRKDGDLKSISETPLTTAELNEIFQALTTPEQQKSFYENFDLDFAIQLDEESRYRVNFFKQARGISAVFRRIPIQIQTLQELNAPACLVELTKLENGLILVTGPTGSGKSTTLAAMLDCVNKNQSGHIITIEDPIEFIHTSQKCLISQREIGLHAQSFSRALRAALREDPDYILVGEMRDLETIQLALTAAETGHLVFASLHTASASKTIDRIIDVFPAPQQAQVRAMLADSIQAIISQTLCKKIPNSRTAAFEILLGTPAVRNLIREGKSHQLTSIIQTSQQLGMQTLEMHLKKLLAAGLISQETYHSKMPTQF